MHAVEAHVAGTHDAHDRVQVCAVVIAQTARFVHELRDLENVLVKDADRVRVRQHESRDIVAEDLFELLEIDASVRRGGDVHDLVAAHRRRRGVGTVRGVRHDDLGALRVVVRIVILLDEQHAREFAVRARCGLEGHAVHAGDLAKILAQRVEHFKCAADRGFRRERMDVRKALHRRRFFVDARVIFHGAGTERIEAAVHAVHLLTKLGVVTGNVGFAHLGKPRRDFAPERFGKRGRGDVALRQDIALAPFDALFKDQLHASTSFTTETTSSSVSLATFSVTHQSMPSS